MEFDPLGAEISHDASVALCVFIIVRGHQTL